MFRSLVPAAAEAPQEITPAFSFEDYALEALSELPEGCAILAFAEELLETHDRLVAFKGAVEQFGLDRSLLAFANYNGSLAIAIPEIPGLESFNTEGAMVLSDAALESIAKKISETGDRWAEALRAHLAKWKRFYQGISAISTSFLASLSFLAGMATGAVVPMTILGAGWLLVGMINHKNYENLRSVPDSIEKALAIPLPKTADEMAVYKKKVSDILNELEVVLKVHVPEKEADEDGKEIEIAKIKEVIGHWQIFAGAVSKVTKETEEKLLKLADSEESHTPEGRAALTWLTKQIHETLIKSSRLAARAAKESKKVAELVKEHHKEDKKE